MGLCKVNVDWTHPVPSPCLDVQRDIYICTTPLVGFTTVQSRPRYKKNDKFRICTRLLPATSTLVRAVIGCKEDYLLCTWNCKCDDKLLLFNCQRGLDCFVSLIHEWKYKKVGLYSRIENGYVLRSTVTNILPIVVFQ